MTILDDAMKERIDHLVSVEYRPFSYRDFLQFEVNGLEHRMCHGTFRNKISKLIKKNYVEVDYRSVQTFYTLKGRKFGKPMTPDHMGVTPHNSFYQMIKDLPLDRNSLHDIRLWFKVPGLWSLLSSNSAYRTNPRSKDIRLPGIKENDLFIGVTVHRPDTITVVIGCSYRPIAVDVNGIIRLSNALTIVKERLSLWVREAGIVIGSSGSKGLVIPAYSEWIVKMWHFGSDASIEYSGERFEVTFDVGQEELIRAYSKQMKDRKTRIRLERQEYPNVPLADAIEEKLYHNSALQ